MNGAKVYLICFSFVLTSLILLIFRAEFTLNICLHAACASASNFISRKSGEGGPRNSVKVVQCMKGKHVLHSELQGSLSLLISVMKCFPPPALRIQASALPQTNLSRVAHTCNNTTAAGLCKGCFSFYEHHFECFLFALLITAMLRNMRGMCVPFAH